jgi:hypothetical protein
MVTWSIFYLLGKGKTLARFVKSIIKIIIILPFEIFKSKEII